MSKRRQAAIVPAQPGYFVLLVDEDERTYVKSPVIAWSISASHADDEQDGPQMVPIYLLATSGEDEAIILDPSGAVTQRGANWWPDLKTFEKYLKAK